MYLSFWPDPTRAKSYFGLPSVCTLFDQQHTDKAKDEQTAIAMLQ